MKSRREFLKNVMLGTAALGMPGGLRRASAGWAPQRNVVLIVCDDLNDYVTGMGGHPQATTPNVARFAETGVAFSHAYCNNPICAPSRSSFLTGIYPHTSMNLSFNPWYDNRVLANSKTIMEHFRDNGYHVAGSGKLMHHLRRSEWSEFMHPTDYGPYAYNGSWKVAHPAVPSPFSSAGYIDGSFAALSDIPFGATGEDSRGWVYGDDSKFNYVDEDNRDPTPDERNAAWAEAKIEQFSREIDEKPFFLAVGFVRPHTPLHVPEHFYDMFPKGSLSPPVILPDDAADCHYAEVIDPDDKGPRYFRLLRDSYPDLDSGLKAFTQAYLASVAAVDECIGKVISAVDNSPLEDNTIIIVTSDHGWNMGEKDYLFKNALWEESTRVPLIIRAPGLAQPGSVAEHPVSLVDLYPTLVDLCHLHGNTRKNDQGAELDGHSLRPFLEDPQAETWDGPEAALTVVAGSSGIAGQHWAVRTKRWRYILYNNGSEELYDHENDPYEWTNLADDANYEAVKADLKTQLFRMTVREEE